MAKPIRVYNEYRIVVIPTLYRNMCEKHHSFNHRTCEDVVKEIERHCDGVDQVYIEVDSGLQCPYCHLEWEEEDDGSPACCQAAWYEWAKEAGAIFEPVQEKRLLAALEKATSRGK